MSSEQETTDGEPHAHRAYRMSLEDASSVLTEEIKQRFDAVPTQIESYVCPCGCDQVQAIYADTPRALFFMFVVRHTPPPPKGCSIYGIEHVDEIHRLDELIRPAYERADDLVEFNFHYMLLVTGLAARLAACWARRAVA